MVVSVISPPLSKDPVSWIHRYEALHLTRELRGSGYEAKHAVFSGTEQLGSLHSPRLLRLTDNLMLSTTYDLSKRGISYAGPEASVLSSCYDKLAAYQTAAASGISCPATMIAAGYRGEWKPVLIKPRRGSDSLGVKVYRNGRIPEVLLTDDFLAQPFHPAMEITVAFLAGRIGRPLWIMRPMDKVYTFRRKHLVPTPRVELSEPAVVNVAMALAETSARIFGVRWACRVDMLFEPDSGELFFLECDAFPAIASSSSFAESMAKAGMKRKEQLEILIGAAS